MQLSPEQLTALRAAAEGEGVDPDALIKAAESELEDDGDKKPAGKDAPTEIKIFQYHLPFLRANELRALLGQPIDVPDGELFCGEWLAKHGGSLAGTPAAKPDTPTE